MTCYLLNDYLPALLWTLAIETAVALPLGCWTPLRILAVPLVSLVTHPLLHALIVLIFFFRLLPSPLPLGLILGLEALVVVAEAFMLSYALRFPAWRAGLVAFAMNGASYLHGAWAE